MLLKKAVVLALFFIFNQISFVEPYECDRVYHYDAATRGEIKSPGYETGRYPEEVSCTYRVHAPQGYRIKITFIDLDIDPTGNCGFDRLTFHEGSDENNLGTFCGHDIPYPIVTSEGVNDLLIGFTSDYMVSGRGFRIQYEAVLEHCGSTQSKCRNRKCYETAKKCDGVDDCGDGTDEESCGMPVALPSSANCGDTPITPDTIYSRQRFSPDRQVGGVPAIPNSWPWQVSLQHIDTEPNAHYCGGTLISPQWIVTAAHCVAGIRNPSNLRIVLGGHNKYRKNRYQVTRIAERIISYPDLEGSNLRLASVQEDISLIKMNAPVVFSDGVQPACLPQQNLDLMPGTLCYSTGWGETRGSGFSDVLKQTEQVVQPKGDMCTIDEALQICVNQPRQSPCHGDSGGPLVCKLDQKWFLMGATSFGSSGNFMGGLCGLAESRIVFAKVSAKVDWIHKTINRIA